jgi:hypothetical protein
MRHLQIEELEPRQLLSGFSLPPPPLLGVVVPGPFARGGEHFYVFEQGGPAGLFGCGWACEIGPQINEINLLWFSGPRFDSGFGHSEVPLFNGGPFRPSGPDFDARGVPALAPVPLVPPGPSAVLLEPLGQLGVDHPGPVPGVPVGSEKAGAATSVIPLPASGTAGLSRRLLEPARETASELPFNTSDPQMPPQLENPVDTAVRVESERVLPSPHVAGAVSLPLSFDLSALELGMKQFLEQVEGLGQHLGDRHGIGSYSWLVALAAAATACEIARRQVKRPPVGPALGVTDTAGFPPEGPFGG